MSQPSTHLEPQTGAPEARQGSQERRFDQAVPYVLSILTAYVVLKGIWVAATTPYWYDEVLTWVLARRPDLPALSNALKAGIDGEPPAFYLVEKLFAALVPNEHIAFRLPSIVAFACVLICVFFFVRTRRGSWHALICTSVLLLTPLQYVYAVEARPYSLFAACIALALVCYQRAAATVWVLLLGLSLGLAECFHYYAVFAVIPFLLAEAVLSLQTRRLRWTVWLALLFAFLPLAASWQILSAFKAHAGVHLWAKPTFARLGATIGAVFNVPPNVGLIVAAVGSLASLAGVVFLTARGIRSEPVAAPFLHELVLVISLLNLPIIVFLAAKFLHGGFLGRYAVPAMLGIPPAIAYVFPRLHARSVSILAAYLALLIGARDVAFWITDGMHPVGVTSPDSFVESFVTSAGRPNLPVVFSSGLDYLPIAHYAPPDWAKRFFAVVDAPTAIDYVGSDTIDYVLLELPSYIPLQVEPFSAFAARHPVFLLYSGDETNEFDWWPKRLKHDGDSVQVLATSGGRKIYLVTLKQN